MRAALAFGVPLCLGAAAPAAATVPPRDCGGLRADGKRFAVMSHLLRCATARHHARRWLATDRRPAGWSCTEPRGTRLKLHCARGDRVLFVIRR